MTTPDYDFLVSTIAPAMNEEGNIDEFIDELSTRDEAERLASSGFDEEE